MSWTFYDEPFVRSFIKFDLSFTQTSGCIWVIWIKVKFARAFLVQNPVQNSIKIYSVAFRQRQNFTIMWSIIHFVQRMHKEDRGDAILWYTANHLQNYIVSQPRRPQSILILVTTTFRNVSSETHSRQLHHTMYCRKC
jgi:hypothetical protein